MRIAIIEADQPREPLVDTYGRYGKLFQDWLAPAMPDAKFVVVSAFEMAPMPDLTKLDGLLITGSRHGVYDNLPWMEPLKQAIRQAREASVRTGGICFGHQIMAEAYGGKVQKSDMGWVLGRDTYRPVLAKNTESAKGKSVFAIHQDQVVSLPEGVNAIHQSKRVPYARLEYDFPALSVQYHPEFHTDFFCALMSHLSGSVLSKSMADAAIASTELGSDAKILADDFAAFYRQ